MPTINEKISGKISDLSTKIDVLYALESLLHDIDSFLYDKSIKYDAGYNPIMDADNNYIYEISDTPKNKLVAEIVEYLTKKYL